MDDLQGKGNMFDGKARNLLDPMLLSVARQLTYWRITPNQITVLALCIGVVAAGAIGAGYFLTGLFFLLLSRFFDGLDGSLAKVSGRVTDFGGFLDIVLDFAFYGIIPLGFILADMEQNALAGSALIFSFYVNGASFLAFSVMAEKRKLSSNARGTKSIYFTTGLAEATETIAVFGAACVFPQWFPLLAWAFAAVCLYTALARILQAQDLIKDR
jgi:phosphatidylglycerophosphate synthase